MLLQRPLNVVQTSWTFGQRLVDVLRTSHVHGEYCSVLGLHINYAFISQKLLKAQMLYQHGDFYHAVLLQASRHSFVIVNDRNLQTFIAQTGLREGKIILWSEV